MKKYRYFLKNNGLLYRLLDNEVEVYNTDWCESGYTSNAIQNLSSFTEIDEKEAIEITNKF